MPDPPHPEPASAAETAREIIACAERTLAAPSARIEWHQELKSPQARWPRPRGLTVRALRLVSRLAMFVARAWWRHSTRHLEPSRRTEFGQLAAEGIAEPARGRYMIDYGSYAQIRTDGKTVSGRSGRSIRERDPIHRPERAGDVLWLVRLLLGATDASGEGTETLHGAVCRRLAAHVDMERASAATAEGLAPPQVDRFEDLRALPVTAWIDGQHVRRIRFEQPGLTSIRRTLDLWEFGVPAEDLDWSRLPTFRSPGHEQKPNPWYKRVPRRYTRVR